MRRFLSGRAITLSHTFLDDEEGTLTPASATVTVTRVGSSTPTAQGSATKTGSVYTFNAGALAEGVYTIRWDGGSTAVDVEQVEVVGGFLFTLPEARNSDPDLTTARFPGPKMREKREAVEQEFERITGRSFTPRTRRITFEHDGVSDVLLLPMRDVRALGSLLASDGSTPTVTLSVDETGLVAGFSALAAGTYSVDVAYGFISPPDDVKRVGIIRLRYLLTAEKSDIPDRATSFQPVDGGTYSLSTPGRGNSETGIPEVDATLARYTYRILNDVLGGVDS